MINQSALRAWSDDLPESSLKKDNPKAATDIRLSQI